jgi:hypothetical protein
MKKLFVLIGLLFAVVFMVGAQVSDSTISVNYHFGDSIANFWYQNMWTLIFAALYFLSEWLGETNKVPEGSVWKKALNFVLSIVKKKAGKVSVIIGAILFLGLGFGGEMKAQENPWKGFFKEKQTAVNQHQFFKSNDTIISISDKVLLFRGSAAVVGTAISIGKNVETSSFSAAGFGISYGAYNETAYCLYSVNAFVMPTFKMGDVVSTKIGGAVTVDVFDKLFGVGIGYADFGSGFKFQILTTLSYSF